MFQRWLGRLRLRPRRSKAVRMYLVLAVAGALVAIATIAGAAWQDQSQVSIAITGTRNKLRMAIADFKLPSQDQATATLAKTFNDVLWNDLNQSGLVDIISKSFYPTDIPGLPTDLDQTKLAAWANAPVSAQRLVFGNLQVAGGTLQVQGYLYDVTQPQSPFMLGKRYTDQPTPPAARMIAHELANAIIEKLGGGAGIATTKIAFISNRTGNKEVWMMDYDGANQTQVTRLNSICYSPRISPDGTRIAFMTYADGTPQIRIISLVTHHYQAFPEFHNLVATPAWSPDGSKLAFASSMSGDVEIYTINADGTGLRRLTYNRGVDIAPVWNPKTGAQIAWESDRTGLPQIYIMDADGTNQQRLTSGGYAVSPSWSPNGLVLAFSWRRKGGGENSNGYDIYLMELASHKWQQMTHNEERNDFPTWAPDGRHVAFESGTPSHTQLFSMLADGSHPAQLTDEGSNEMPNWSSQ